MAKPFQTISNAPNMLSCKSTTPWRNRGHRTNISNTVVCWWGDLLMDLKTWIWCQFKSIARSMSCGDTTAFWIPAGSQKAREMFDCWIQLNTSTSRPSQCQTMPHPGIQAAVLGCLCERAHLNCGPALICSPILSQKTLNYGRKAKLNTSQQRQNDKMNGSEFDFVKMWDKIEDFFQSSCSQWHQGLQKQHPVRRCCAPVGPKYIAPWHRFAVSIWMQWQGLTSNWFWMVLPCSVSKLSRICSKFAISLSLSLSLQNPRITVFKRLSTDRRHSVNSPLPVVLQYQAFAHFSQCFCSFMYRTSKERIYMDLQYIYMIYIYVWTAWHHFKFATRVSTAMI